MLAFPATAPGPPRRSRGAGLVAALLATRSAGSMYLSIEFVKNGLGLTLAITALWVLLRALERPTRARVASVVLAVVLATLAHKMAAALVIAIAIPAVLAQAAARGQLRGRRLIYVLALLAATVLGVIVLGLAAPQRFLSPADLALVGALFTTDARWTLPALARGDRVLALGHEALLALGLALVAAAILATSPGAQRRDAGLRVVAWSCVTLALLIGLPWLDVSSSQGLAFRLRLAAFVPLALCGAIVAGAGLAVARTRFRAALVRRGGLDELTIDRHARRAEILAVALALGVLALRTPGTRTDGRVLAHPAMIAATQAVVGRIPAGHTAIIPERHILFMVAWYARVPVSLRPDTVPVARRWRVMPRHFVGFDSELDTALLEVRDRRGVVAPIGVHPLHPNGLVIVAEPTWELVLASLPPALRARWASWPTI